MNTTALLDELTGMMSSSGKQAVIALLGGTALLVVSLSHEELKASWMHVRLPLSPVANSEAGAMTQAYQYLANRNRVADQPQFWATDLLMLAHDIALHIPGWENVAREFYQEV